MVQRELARSAGVSLSLVRKLEQGDYGNGLRLETVRRLAVALDVTTSALMSEPDAAEAEPGEVATWEPVRRALAYPVMDGALAISDTQASSVPWSHRHLRTFP